MQNVLSISSMPMTCPECETELDQVSGVCPACRWDTSRVAAPVDSQDAADETYTDRYRGTAHHHQMSFGEANDEGTMRARAFLIVAMVGLLGLFYFVAESLYLI